MNDITIRPLTVYDRQTLTELIKKLSSKTGYEKIVTAIPAQLEKTEENGENVEIDKNKSDDTVYSLISSVLYGIVTWVNDDVSIWFADLLGISLDEFKKLPFDTEMKIVEQMLNQESFKDFFIKASGLLSSIPGSKNLLNTLKTQFVST